MQFTADTDKPVDMSGVWLFVAFLLFFGTGVLLERKAQEAETERLQIAQIQQCAGSTPCLAKVKADRLAKCHGDAECIKRIGL